jgi:hypothetical protein
MILHNMRREEYVSGTGNKYKPDDVIFDEFCDDESQPFDMDSDSSSMDNNYQQPQSFQDDMEQYTQRWKSMTDKNEHNRLQQAVMNQVWNARSNR